MRRLRSKNRNLIAWDESCARAFEEIKTYLQRPPLLVHPEQGEALTLYLATTDEAVSSVLVKEEAGVQQPVYYASKVLKKAEVNYSPIEN